MILATAIGWADLETMYMMITFENDNFDTISASEKIITDCRTNQYIHGVQCIWWIASPTRIHYGLIKYINNLHTETIHVNSDSLEISVMPRDYVHKWIIQTKFNEIRHPLPRMQKGRVNSSPQQRNNFRMPRSIRILLRLLILKQRG